MTRKLHDQFVLGGLLTLSLVVNLLITIGLLNTYCWFWNLLFLLMGLLLLVNDSSPYKKQVSYPMCGIYLGWACSVLLAITASM